MTTRESSPEVGPSDVADPLEAVAAVLRSHNIEAIVVDTGAEAARRVLGLIPDGAEVHSGKSKTLEDIGLYAEIVESGRYDAIRPRLVTMDRATQGREIRKLVAAPGLHARQRRGDHRGRDARRGVRNRQPARCLRGGRRSADPGHRQPEARPRPRCRHAPHPEVVFPWENDRCGSGSASTRGSRRSSSSTASGTPDGRPSCWSASRSGSDARSDGHVDRQLISARAGPGQRGRDGDDRERADDDARAEVDPVDPAPASPASAKRPDHGRQHDPPGRRSEQDAEDDERRVARSPRSSRRARRTGPRTTGSSSGSPGSGRGSTGRRRRRPPRRSVTVAASVGADRTVCQASHSRKTPPTRPSTCRALTSRSVIAPSPNAAIAPYVASAVATPSPETSPTAGPRRASGG